MIYEALKSLVEWLKESYKCPECDSWISEKDIDIVWAAWNTANFDITCPNCSKHWMIKSQLIVMDLDWITNVKKSIEDIKSKIKQKENHKISDNEIVKLDKSLKNKSINVSDLFE